MTVIAERRAAFRALHESGCFVMPNPWDGGSALRLSRLGFKALASTSAGAAWALGRADGEMQLEEVLAHLEFLVGLTLLPINADFESGFADTPEGVSRNVRRCIETGVAGLSIEDRIGKSLYSPEEAVARLRAARSAIDQSGEDVLLVGRCESYLIGQPDLPAVIERLRAYEQAGADCLYAPGIKDISALATLVRAVRKPVNAHLWVGGPSADELAAVGVRRISLGATLAHASWVAFEQQARKLADQGRI